MDKGQAGRSDYCYVKDVQVRPWRIHPDCAVRVVQQTGEKTGNGSELRGG